MCPHSAIDASVGCVYICCMVQHGGKVGLAVGASRRSEVIATRIEPELWLKLCNEADRHGRTISEYVRLVLIEKIKAVQK